MHPELGTQADLEALVGVAREHGVEIALDFAIQMSPDHPWLTEHPEWFQRRPDGSLKFAENPPKRYQDIHNVNWETTTARALGGAARRGAPLVRGRSHDLPSRQPAHQAGAVLGVADRRGPRRTPTRCSSRRRSRARAMMTDARQGRLLAELHLLHVEELEGRADRARRPAAVLARLPTAEPLAQHAGHPSRDARRTAAGPHSSRGSFSRRPSHRATGSTPATRHAKTSRCAKRARSTSTRRSTRWRELSRRAVAPAAQALNERAPSPTRAAARGKVFGGSRRSTTASSDTPGHRATTRCSWSSTSTRPRVVRASATSLPSSGSRLVHRARRAQRAHLALARGRTTSASTPGRSHVLTILCRGRVTAAVSETSTCTSSARAATSVSGRSSAPIRSKVGCGSRCGRRTPRSVSVVGDWNFWSVGADPWTAGHVRGLGRRRCKRDRGSALQVCDHQPFGEDEPARRPGCLPRRAAARHRLHRLRLASRLGDDAWLGSDFRADSLSAPLSTSPELHAGLVAHGVSAGGSSRPSSGNTSSSSASRTSS